MTAVWQTSRSVLICCVDGEVLEVECPEPLGHDADVAKTFHMATQTTRTYKFLSIKSKILVSRPESFLFFVRSPLLARDEIGRVSYIRISLCYFSFR